MRLERLLGIITYLLNHEAATARKLAERFEVSVRTIQRDMEALNLAGIPVVSARGAAGGYMLMDGFRLGGQLINRDDYSHILTAVSGLCSAYDSHMVAETLEKLRALAPQTLPGGQGLRLDLGVMREGLNTVHDLATLRTAIDARHVVRFIYTDAENQQRHRQVEPLTVIYRWYAWYLFGFCRMRQDYRLFRLSRIRQLEMGDPFSAQHRDVHTLLEKYDARDQHRYLHIRMLCQPETRISLEERFPDAEFRVTPEGLLMVEMRLPENERGWYGWLLSYGKQICVLEPECVRQRLAQTAREILDNYATNATDCCRI